MDSTEKSIAIAFDLNFRHAAEIFAGVSEFIADAQVNWRLIPLNFGFEAKLMDLAKSGRLAGAIGTFVSDGWVAGLSERGVAAVNLFNFSRIESIPSVSLDDRGLGIRAAKHLLEQGARRFAFCGADGVYYTRLRRESFAESLPEKCSDLRPGPALRGQIAELGAGDGLFAIFCASDSIARNVIVEATGLGLRCGKDFLVLGIDNEPSESIFAGIGISSFKLPSKTIGRAAAEKLHALLSGAPSSNGFHSVGQAVLVARESSLASNRARIAQLAVNLLNESLGTPGLDIESVARSLGTSRRSLELAFKERVGTSPYRYLSDARIQRAKHLLVAGPESVMEIGRQIGYPEPHHFSAWFKQQTGLAPKMFRVQKAGSAKGTPEPHDFEGPRH